MRRIVAENPNAEVSRKGDAFPDQPNVEGEGGPFGDSYRGVLMDKVKSLSDKVADGTATRDEQKEYGLAYSELSRKSVVTLPNGKQHEIDGVNLSELKYPLPTLLSTPGSAQRETVDPTQPSRTRPAPEKILSTAERENIKFRQEANKMLDIMDQHIGETGRVQGMFGEVGAFLGTNEDAVAFKTARSKMRLALQASIKGVPSDRDQQLVDDLLPSLTDPPAVVRTKIDIQRAALNAVDEADRDYFEENNMAIPQALREAEAGQEIRRVTKPSEAAELPPGTLFMTPDGQIRERQ